MIDLDGLERMAAARTGEWSAEPYSGDAGEVVDADGVTVVSGNSWADCEYLASLHNALPQLIRELRAAREERREIISSLKKRLSDLRFGMDKLPEGKEWPCRNIYAKGCVLSSLHRDRLQESERIRFILQIMERHSKAYDEACK